MFVGFSAVEASLRFSRYVTVKFLSDGCATLVEVAVAVAVVLDLLNKYDGCFPPDFKATEVNDDGVDCRLNDFIFVILCRKAASRIESLFLRSEPDSS